VPDETASVMLIGHNPGMQQLALELAARGDELDRLEAKFPTAALATLSLTVSWSDLAPGAATLAAFVVPRELRD
jgi:phosphohistidine phosphatase